MLDRKRRLAAASALTAALLAGVVALPAYADSFGVFYYDSSNGFYALGGGDVYWVNEIPPGWPNFGGNVRIAFAQANGRNILQLDTQNSSANNGYLGIYPGDISSWVSTLQGNLDFVQSQAGSQQFTVTDSYTASLTHLVPFATVANESGATVSDSGFTANGGTYTDPSTGKTYPTYNHNFTVSPSAPPTANSISATVNGNTVTLHFNNTVPLWYQLATHHFDQITIVDSNGKVVWQPSDTSNAGVTNVQVESGSQYSNRVDDITPPVTFASGTYTVTASVWDGVDRQSNTVTTTFTVGSGGSGGGGSAGKDSIVLTANPTNLPVGQSSTLTATTGGLSNGHAWGIEIVDQGSDRTIGGSNQAWSDLNVTSFNTTATSQSPLTDTYVAYLIDTVTWQQIASNTVTVTWNNSGGGGNGGGSGGGSGGGTGGGGGSGGGGSGQCPAPYDSDAHWVSLGNGDEELVWTRHDPYPIYQNEEQCTTDANGQQHCRTVRVFVGCGDNTTQKTQVYRHSVTNGQISGLSYDPGTPTNMWMPVPSWQWDPAQCPGLFCDLYQRHGWTGWEVGGPNANQISSDVWVNGQLFHTYGPPIGQQTPTVWVRVDGGFGFRYVWTGSPHAIPTSGTVTFTMTNPDGGSITWTKPLILNTETLQTQGTNLLGLDEPPPPASEVFSCWTDIPKGVYKNGQPEEAAWSLSNDPATAFAQGAHISFTVTVNTPAGDFTVSAPNVASTLGVPAYWFTRLENDSLLQAAQNNQTNASLGIIYGDPSVGLPPGDSSRLGY